MRYIESVKPPGAPPLTAAVYRQVRREFGALVEPFTLHSPVPELLAGVWTACRETLLAGRVARSTKEAVAATVSRTNECPYCVDAHTIMLHSSSLHGPAHAIGMGRDEDIGDPHLRNIVQWAALSRTPGAGVLRAPPFDGRDAPEIIGTAVVFHYINRMVTVFLAETPLPSRRRWLRGPLKRIASLVFARAVKRDKTPGTSLALLPGAPLPGDMGWALASPHVAGALARFAAVVESLGSFLPEAVRGRVRERLEEWDGKDPGLGRRWVEDAVGDLDERSRRACRMALLAAFAPYQVDEQAVREFLDLYPGPGMLLSALAWGSLQAARRIGSWLGEPFADNCGWD